MCCDTAALASQNRCPGASQSASCSSCSYVPPPGAATTAAPATATTAAPAAGTTAAPVSGTTGAPSASTTAAPAAGTTAAPAVGSTSSPSVATTAAPAPVPTATPAPVPTEPVPGDIENENEATNAAHTRSAFGLCASFLVAVTAVWVSSFC
jgi:hypothetical protein